MTDIAREARRIHADLPVVDGHNDLPWKIRTTAGEDVAVVDHRRRSSRFHTDIPRMIDGGVGAQFWSVYVPADIEDAMAATMRQIDLVEAMIAGDNHLEAARTAQDIRTIRARGHIASLLGAEGGHCIEGSLANLAKLADRGVRYMTLTHSDTTSWADSATDVARHGGLTAFGRDVVREMNRLGMLVDLAHVADDTMRAAIDVSRAPVISSHSNARALAPHPRNIPDDILAAIGDSGGVIMVVFFPGFLVASTAAALQDLFIQWRAMRARFRGDEAAIAAAIDRAERDLDVDHGSVRDVVDHIEYIAGIAGVDGVGLGSDFDGMTMTPAGLGDVSCYPRITEELLRRGWGEVDVRKVLGENTLRVLEAAETVAAST